ncbi:MAG: molecular chaperone HtpG [Ruminococcaceae bacterium]|nr:molecular chaperone HtpG [Oscillospiraceae bacterium]
MRDKHIFPHGFLYRKGDPHMSEIFQKRGDISVETAHIFPIIKKWLYSEKDIFLREIVSNAQDAVTKHKRLVSLGQAEDKDISYRLTVSVNQTAGTLSVTDNGIGMTEDELLRYLGNIALSGALEFIQKYEGDNPEDNKNGIIGHFGLGFYSAFMVADTVEVISKSYTDAPAVRWVCRADGAYELYPAEKDEQGTTVVMHINQDESTYLEATKIRDMLDKYCAFMPTEIYFENECTDEAENKETENNTPAPINDTFPLWQKSPSECTPEEYKDFYRKVFRDFREPLFWIHINADYPLNFKGILYFPRLNNQYESIEGQVKLYYNQVFVADNVGEVIPDYLLMLRGVLDCPQLPLNVSRSYLQNNTYVAKVSAHIVKKVADKLNSLCDNEREVYEGVWDSIRPFVEYACMRDRKFYDRAKDAVLLHLTDGRYVTIPKYLEEVKEKQENTVFYTTDKELQARYISLFDAQGIPVAITEQLIDTQFLQMLESYDSTVQYRRIDADIAAALTAENGDTSEIEEITALFRKVSGKEDLDVKYHTLKDTSLPAMLTVSEESRRMEEMMRMYAMQSGGQTPDFPISYTLLVNNACPLISRLSALNETDPTKAELIAGQIYRLSVLSQRKLTAEELKEFLTESFGLLSML